MCEIINFEQAKRALIKAKAIKATKRQKSARALAREKARKKWKEELEKEIAEALEGLGEPEDFSRFILRPENFRERLGLDKMFPEDKEK